MIGSKDWQEKWHIGLDSDRETSDNEPIDEMSESSSSSSIVSLHSHIPASMSESDHSVWGIDATAGVSVTGPQKKGLFSDETRRQIPISTRIFRIFSCARHLQRELRGR